ncbi:ectoine/hydroxyectoine ABC transporter substrate-binding protein EhuB [Actinomadura barringtoniae]|uniref:Ectoine/hydroxyectoine ABC transporter substrate-binding protein EhuB n=1 Tax=Actinomadura barringtoniae TaxID=1427535 RepID=A0A939PIA4_9ACTN|nr:ectoine/hydroxyectoine ABC transporter substrate-binding protein EhuB [Actinomadura barringtoniae]MBO2449689.1 ectoine/hydroxyectoine ABC transporter substrate-binding protein EhuB [Actinomadura barringtoniae]
MTSSRRDFLRSGVLLAGAVPILGAAACSTTDPDKEKSGGGTLEKAKKQGYIQVGYANESPYGFTTAGGKLTGEAPELAKIIFKELGINEIRGVQVAFDGLIPGVQAKRFDAIAAGMFINAKRCAAVAFADPEYIAKTAFLVPKGNPKGIKNFDDASKKKAKVGVMKGAVEADYAAKLGVSEGNIKTFPDAPGAFDGIKAGRCDCIALTRISLVDLLSKHKGDPFEVTDAFDVKIDGKEQFGAGGFGFRKADTDLVQAFNGKLAELKQNGRLLQTLQPFGFSQAEMPGDHKAAEFCQA